MCYKLLHSLIKLCCSLQVSFDEFSLIFNPHFFFRILEYTPLDFFIDILNKRVSGKSQCRRTTAYIVPSLRLIFNVVFVCWYEKSLRGVKKRVTFHF